MNKEIKAKWTEALRSGKYKQGQRELQDPKGKFCCLGVLCEVLEVPKQAYGVGIYYGEIHERSSAFLPISVMKQVELTVQEQSLLANMNDEGQSFKKIADYIDRTL